MAKRKKRKLHYTPHVVTYIDILGFRELIHEKSPGAISRAIRHVRDVTVPDADKLKFDRENYVNFSDLIVHTVPVHSKSNREKPWGIVSHEIRYIAMVQAVLIEKDILLRGTITIGEIERSYGVLFGPGLIAAYELERDQAVYPRIVVDHRLTQALRSVPLLRHRHRGYEDEMKVLSDVIRRDDDGVIFVDYLGFMQKALENSPRSYRSLLETHRRLVERNLAKFRDNNRVLSKYLWLRKYHNAVVQGRMERQSQEHLLIRKRTGLHV
jgi:hypothetical protein